MRVDGRTIIVKGPKGELKETIHPAVNVTLMEGADGGEIEVKTDVGMGQVTDTRAQWGTARALIANMVHGVTKGFSKKLEINGIGFRVNLQGRTIVLNIGFSHDIRMDLPEGLSATVDGNTIEIFGASRHDVGAFADRIRRIRKPEPYKGKGIKYVDEIIRRKAGKAAQKATE